MVGFISCRLMCACLPTCQKWLLTPAYSIQSLLSYRYKGYLSFFHHKIAVLCPYWQYKHTKRSSTLLAVMEIQIRTINIAQYHTKERN